MGDNGLVVRRMSEADLERALDWAAAEGWNPGLHDARCFQAADAQGKSGRLSRAILQMSVTAASNTRLIVARVDKPR